MAILGSYKDLFQVLMTVLYLTFNPLVVFMANEYLIKCHKFHLIKIILKCYKNINI